MLSSADALQAGPKHGPIAVPDPVLLLLMYKKKFYDVLSI